MALLHVDHGERQGDVIQLDRDVIVLGRSPDCDEIISKQETVSRWHARVLRIDTQFFIEDHEESRNRTFVNDQKIAYKTQVQLAHQDKIRICEFEATFLDVDNDSTVEAMLSSSSDHKLETHPAAKLAILLEIIAKLSHTLQLDAQLPAVADGLLRIFPQADRCFLIMVDPATGALIPKLAKGRIHVDEIRLQFSRTIVNQCLKSAKSLLLREGDALPASSHSVNVFHIRSVMCVPLSGIEEKPFGVIQLDTQDSAKKFTAEDLHLFSGVVNQVALALENARLHQARLEQQLAQERAKREHELAEERLRAEQERARREHELAEERLRAEQDLVKREQVRVSNELEIARQVQLNFLPKSLPAVPGYEFFAYYKAAREVGGDYYDFVLLPEHRWAITLGDVAGKGMPAALLMAKLSSESRSCLLTEGMLTGAIGKLNDNLHPSTSPMDRFVTLIAAVLDPATHTVTLVNAGHPTPLWYHCADRKYTKAIPPEDDGQSLGHALGGAYQCYQVKLDPGDSLLFYSDGVTDAQSQEGKPFRMKGIYKIFDCDKPGSPRDLGQRLVDSLTDHVKDGLQYDDITLVCFGRPA